MSADAPDLRAWVWVRDLVLLGGGIGALAPGGVLVPLAVLVQQNAGPIAGFTDAGLVLLLARSGAMGGALGVPVGVGLWAATRLARDRPLLLVPVGFPVGALAGAVAGWVVSDELPVGNQQVVWTVTLLGAVVGGLVLGLGWLPYLALKLRGRSGLPWMLAAALASAVAGPLVLASVMLLGL